MTDIPILVVVKSDCFANEFRIINGGHWLCIMRFNGELMPVRQGEYARRMVASWNACEGIDVESLEGSDNLPNFLQQMMNERDQWKARAEFSYQERSRLEEKKFARFRNEDCWIFQGDGNDALETLICPVVIKASELLRLITLRDELLSALKVARTWIGDGENSDGMSREFWTQQYAEAVDMIDAAIAKVEGNHASTRV